MWGKWWWLSACACVNAKVSSKLLRLSRDSSVISLDSKDVIQFLKSEDDSLTLALLLNAHSKNCAFCDVADAIYANGVEKLAASRDAAGQIYDGSGKPVVFGKMDVLQNLEAAAWLGLRDVPHLFVIRPDREHCTGSSCTLRAPDQLSKIQSLGVSGTILEPLLRELGRSDLYEKFIKTSPSRMQGIGRKVAVALLIVLLPMSGLIAKWMRERMWVTGCLATLIFAVSTSGIIYNWQNGLWRLFGHREDGHLQLADPNMRSQYFGEGLLFSTLNVMLPIVAYAATNCLRRRERGYAFAALMAAGCALCLFAFLNHYIHLKVPYLQYGVLPPDNSYVLGGPRNDKRYAI